MPAAFHFFTQALEMLGRLLTYRARNRLSAEEVVAVGAVLVGPFLSSPPNVTPPSPTPDNRLSFTPTFSKILYRHTTRKCQSLFLSR